MWYKSEIRSTKSETNYKLKIPIIQTYVWNFENWNLRFVSDFEFSASDLESGLYA